MNISRKVTLGSLLIGLGFFMLHLLPEAIREKDLSVFVVGLLFLVAAFVIGVFMGLFRVGTTHLGAWLKKRQNKELQSSGEDDS